MTPEQKNKILPEKDNHFFRRKDVNFSKDIPTNKCKDRQVIIHHFYIGPPKIINMESYILDLEKIKVQDLKGIIEYCEKENTECLKLSGRAEDEKFFYNFSWEAWQIADLRAKAKIAENVIGGLMILGSIAGVVLFLGYLGAVKIASKIHIPESLLKNICETITPTVHDRGNSL